MHNIQSSTKKYFEAIIQLRPKNKELLQFVKKQIEKKSNVFISQEIHKKFGTDLYISSNKFALQLGKKLKQSFKGKLTTTRTLYATNKLTSKGVYRVTVCFRLEKNEE